VKEHVKIHNFISEIDNLNIQVKSLKTQVEELEVELKKSQKIQFKKKAKTEDNQQA
jgi:predicted ATP-grasp superfamily ATP-dependent carboligase